MPRPGTSSRKEASRRYYEAHKEEIAAKRKATRTQASLRKKGTREWMRARLAQIKEESPCVDCGVNYPYYVMDFDHVRGEKKLNLARMVSTTYSWEAIMEEVEKCEIVCSNCHRERTHTRK